MGFKDWTGNIEGVPWYKFKIILHWTYYDIGMGKLSILKYFWLLGGFGSIMAGGNYLWTLLIGVIYVLVSYVLGWAFYQYGWLEADIEVGNQVNPFVKGMRKTYKVDILK